MWTVENHSEIELISLVINYFNVLIETKSMYVYIVKSRNIKI